MKRRTARKWTIAAGSIIALVGVIWFCVAEPILIFIRTDQTEMDWQMSVTAFSTIYDRLPRSVEEMVNAHVLPKTGEIYYCNLAYESRNSKTSPYQQNEFEILFDEQETIIRIPAEIFEAKMKKLRFRWLSLRNRNIKILAGTRFGDSQATNRFKYSTNRL